jgi:hypothetical protein
MEPSGRISCPDMSPSAALSFPGARNGRRRSSRPRRRSTTPLTRRPSCIGTRIPGDGRDDQRAACAMRENEQRAGAWEGSLFDESASNRDVVHRKYGHFDTCTVSLGRRLAFNSHDAHNPLKATRAAPDMRRPRRDATRTRRCPSRYRISTIWIRRGTRRSGLAAASRRYDER